MKMRHANSPELAGSANDTWRTWLMTGVRRNGVDRRRVRGAHLGIKKMLVEGMQVRSDKPYTWKDFSDAMVRQSVGEAMRELPRRDSELVKLAYFGGMSNRELADHMRMPEGTVERRLRRALDTISRYIERGRGLGQRALVGLMVWLCGRRLGELSQHWAQAGAVAAATVIILAQPAAPARTGLGDPHAKPTAPAPAMTVVPPVPSPTVPVSGQSAPSVAAPVPVPAVQLPTVTLPPVQLPPVQVPPVKLPPLPSPPPVNVKKRVL